MFPALLLRYLNLYLNFSGYVAGLECASEEAGEWFREKKRTVYSALVIVVVGVGLPPLALAPPHAGGGVRGGGRGRGTRFRLAGIGTVCLYVCVGVVWLKC